jgi:threonine dehydratase
MSMSSRTYVPSERVVHPTTVIESTRLNNYLGMKVVLASETFQETGSFKFRAAYYVASSVPEKLLITASSGNFGQALTYACALTGKSCIVVMPSNSSQTKIAGVRAYGGHVELIDTRVKMRKDRVRELASEHPKAYIASSADDLLVIAGNSSLGREISSLGYALDFVIAPIGGGGLASGLIVGIRQATKGIPVIGAEPLLGNDAARSMREGRIVSNEFEPMTIADGARTISIGEHNWAILQNGLEDIIEVPESKIAEAVRLLFALANLKVEPTGALSVAAMLTAPGRFRNRTVCCVVSGGNVDPTTFMKLLDSGTS